MFEKIKQIASIKKLLLIVIIFLAMFIPMNNYVSKWQHQAGTKLMDFIFGGYSAKRVANILQTIGVSGRMRYLHMLVLDCCMGILYLLLLLCLIGYLLKKYFDQNRRLDWLLLLPLMGMLSDWTENLMTCLIINNYPARHPVLVAIESTGTTLKFTFLGLAFLSAIALLVVGVIKQRLKNS